MIEKFSNFHIVFCNALISSCMYVISCCTIFFLKQIFFDEILHAVCKLSFSRIIVENYNDSLEKNATFLWVRKWQCFRVIFFALVVVVQKKVYKCIIIILVLTEYIAMFTFLSAVCLQLFLSFSVLSGQWSRTSKVWNATKPKVARCSNSTKLNFVEWNSATQQQENGPTTFHK